MSGDSAEQIAARSGLDRATVAERLEALDLTSSDRAALRAFAPLVESQADGFIDGLYERFRSVPELAPLLGSESQVERLKRMQRQYLVQLFAAELDWPYVLSRATIGAVHHRVGLTPQWFLATYAHFVADHVPLLLENAATPAAGIALVTTLLKSAIFDATIVLDAYGMAEELSLRERNSIGSSGHPGGPNEAVPGGVGRKDGRSLTRVRVTAISAGERRGYVGLTEEHLASLRRMDGIWQSSLPQILDDFYRFFLAHGATRGLVPPDAVARLREQVRSYWQEFAGGEFDRLYATSRMRVGVVHERIGLLPQWYLIGLALQAEGLLRLGAEGTEPSGIALYADAFLRGVFFDVSYVMDAYMEARAETILRTEGYASQLVAGLTSGVLVIDGNRRVVSVNRTLLELLRVESAMLYRVPIEQVITLPELHKLLDCVEPGRRASVTGKLAGRYCRLSVMRLDAWEGVHGRPMAIIVEDISELIRLATESEQNDARLAALIQSVDMAVWEMDPLATTIDLVSAPVLALTGYRDVYFLGRRDAWTRCLPEPDRNRFRAYAETLPVDGRGVLEYRMIRADGRQIWVRTSLRRGKSVLFGVTVDITNERLTEQRRVERDQALARDRAKSDLLATMSHEIRTPLNGVIGMLDYLLGSPLDPQYAGHVRTAQDSALELLELLNDILDLSKLEAGRMELHPQRFDLAALTEGLRDLFGQQAGAKGLDWQVMLAPGLPSGWIGDVHRIRQILVNLCSNAVKFTKSGGITMIVDATGTGLRFVVEDSGPGVAEGKRGLLFQPFSQMQVTSGGTGLGLSISQRLAHLMGGEVRYEDGVGGGSRFLVNLPLEVAPPESLPAGNGREVVVLLKDGGQLLEGMREAGWRVVTEPALDAWLYFIDDAQLIAELPGDAPVVLCGRQRPE